MFLLVLSKASPRLEKAKWIKMMIFQVRNLPAFFLVGFVFSGPLPPFPPRNGEPFCCNALWDPFDLQEARQEWQDFHVMVGRWGFSCLKWSLFRGHVKFSGGVSDVFFWNVRLSSCFFRGDGTLSAGIFVDFQALPLEVGMSIKNYRAGWRVKTIGVYSMSIIDYPPGN